MASGSQVTNCSSQSIVRRLSDKVIWQKATSLFYHIRQVAARLAKLVLVRAFGTTIFGNGEVVRISDSKIQNSDICFLWGSYCDQLRYLKPFDINLSTNVAKLTGVGHFGTKVGEE